MMPIYNQQPKRSYFWTLGRWMSILALAGSAVLGCKKKPSPEEVIKTLQVQIAEQEAKYKQLSAEKEDLMGKNKGLSSQNEGLREKIKQYEAKVKGLSSQLSSEEFQQLQKELGSLTKIYRELERGIEGEPDLIKSFRAKEAEMDHRIGRNLEERIGKLKAQTTDPKRLIDLKDLEVILKSIDSHVHLPAGRYLVDFDITVNPTGILEIEPGTEIYFGPESGILSYGPLRAAGAKKEGILFTASKNTWKGIAIVGKFANDSVLEYCTITNGGGRDSIPKTRYFDGITIRNSLKAGGGLWIESSNPTIRNCVINSNAADFGAGIYIRASTKAIIEGCTISSNRGVYGAGVQIESSNPIIRNNLIKSNRVDGKKIGEKEEKGSGGGLNLHTSNAVLENNVITYNYADFGGGMRLYKSNPTLKGNTITNNTARQSGGGVSTSESKPVFGKNTIKENKPKDTN